jgi:SOS-response transcriptional repressor LexA
MNKRKRNQRAMRRQYRRYQQEMSRQHQNRTYNLAYPKGTQPSDSFEAIEMVDDSLSGIGIQPKDVAIVFHTDDFKSGDLVLFKNSLEQFIGKYYPAPGGLMRLEPLNDEYETDILSPRWRGCHGTGYSLRACWRGRA